MSNDQPQSADAQRLEQIVAYLDGELPPEECADVERRLSTDEDFRRELQRVDRAWSALDQLPRATVDDKFSRTTLDMVVAAADQELMQQTQVLPTLRRRRRLSTALLAVSAVLFGFLVYRLSWDDPNESLIADLPVVQQLDAYRQFNDVGFLRELKERSGPQLESLAHDEEELEQRLVDLQQISDPKNRRDWLKSLSEQQKQNLRARYNQFLVLPPSQQEELRQLHADVVNDPDAQQLQRTMLLYRQWLDGQPPGRQFELRISPAAERLDRIGAQLKFERCDAKFALSDDQLRRLEASIRPAVDRLVRGNRYEASWPVHRKMQALTSKHFEDRLRAELEGRGRDEAAEDGEDKDGLYQALLDGLPEPTREAFERIPPKFKAAWFRNWVRKIVSLRGEISQQELERFFAEDLDAETREQLLSRPPDEMQDALLKHYMSQPNLNEDGAGEPFGEGRRRGGPGDPRREMRPPPDGFGRFGPGGEREPPWGRRDGRDGRRGNPRERDKNSEDGGPDSGADARRVDDDSERP